MAYEAILFEKQEHVAILTLNRPERLNSFNTEMHAEVRAGRQDCVPSEIHLQRMLAGFDWGARAADIVAALWPERCSGLVSPWSQGSLATWRT